MTPMRLRYRALLLAGMLAASGGTLAQAPADWNPRSGDAWVDTWLGDINRYGARYREPFIDEVVRYHAAPRALVTQLLVERGWAPGDVYFACALAQVVGRPCRDVADAWTRDHAQGWGAVAKGLGLAPGSAGFHHIKNGIVPAYDRWARPIELDADLRRVYPDHRSTNVAAGASGKSPPAATADRAKATSDDTRGDRRQ